MIKRPLIRYHGGKWRLGPWIVGHLPAHRLYVEPFGGGGSILLLKQRSHSEIYNDLDDEIVNLFRVVRDQGAELARRVQLTPYSRVEFIESYQQTDDALEKARRTLVRAYMGFGSAAVTGQPTGFRSKSTQSGTSPARDWMNYPENLMRIIDRLQGVVIENRDAVQVMQSYDCPEALHYVDPPYVHATRSFRSRAPAYRFEMTDEEHKAMAAVLHGLKGNVVLSGYRCDLYDTLFSDWRRVDIPARADGAKERLESVWLSPSCPGVRLFDVNAA